MDIVGWLKDAGNGIWHFVSGAPRDIFGDRIDSAWGLTWISAMALVALIFAIAGWNSLNEWAKGVDSGWDPEWVKKENQKPENRLDQYNINWRKAYEQKVGTWRFAIPFGLMVLGLFYVFIQYAFSGLGYVKISLLCFAFAPVLRYWWIRVLVRTNRRLVKQELLNEGEQVILDSSWGTFKHYIEWGLAASGKQRRLPWRRKLRWFNGIVKFVRLDWIRVRLIKPILLWAFYATFWWISMPWSVFQLTQDLRGKKKFHLMPAWAPKRVIEPEWPGGNATVMPKLSDGDSA